jgi:hypothetical protein
MWLAVTTDDATSGFYVEEEGAGATCYCSGTLIPTALGAVPLEELQIGDLAVTASGVHRPIRWLGRRTTDCHNHHHLDQVSSIRVAHDAFGQNRPAQDLYVSPGHSICIDDAVRSDAALRSHADFCCPFVSDGPILEAIGVQLRRQAESLGCHSTCRSLWAICILSLMVCRLIQLCEA